MNPREALQLLDNLTSSVPLKREEHAKVAEAVNALSKLIPSLNAGDTNADSEPPA